MDVKYVKPLKDKEAIEALFAEHGAKIPQGFTDFFVKYNGGRPLDNTCVLKDGSERVVNSFLSFNEEDKENVYKAIRRVGGDNQRLIPFAGDPAGNYYCLLDGRVVFWSHEDGEIIEAAESLEAFYHALR